MLDYEKAERAKRYLHSPSVSPLDSGEVSPGAASVAVCRVALALEVSPVLGASVAGELLV
jgi:hypothetical protein